MTCDSKINLFDFKHLINRPFARSWFDSKIICL